MYAFGVLLWEMMNGQRAWDGLTPAQVMLAVALQKQTLKYTPAAPPELVRQGLPSTPSVALVSLTPYSPGVMLTPHCGWRSYTASA